MLSVNIVYILLPLFGGLLPRTSAFLWDAHNVERLFNNADIIFNDIITNVPESDKLCVNQFKYFVEKLGENQEWALKCRFLLIKCQQK